ncbi:MAG: hypothetical protein K2P67_06325 [Gallionellaceae bacterium]|nr:hypothetical protein [Gallionellaceae bacterium]
MKKLLISSVVAVLFMGAPVAYADDAHHPDQQGRTEKVTVPASTDGEKVVQEMQENEKKMQARLDKIQKTKDPELRQKLMMEYMQTMHENMMLGRSMMHGMMDCTMMKGGMMGEGEAGASPDAMMDRMNRMEKRMDMMQMMMEQMTKSQTPPAK